MKKKQLFERLITATEARKGHITIREEFRALFEPAFGKLLHEDSPASRRGESLQRFERMDTGEQVSLKLCMRNKTRREIRLYLHKGNSGYNVTPNSILMIEFNGRKPRIGSRPSGLKRTERIYPAEKSPTRLPRPRDEERETNDVANTLPSQWTAKEKKVWRRSRKLVYEILKAAGYQCEAGWEANPFSSKATTKRYLEVHHLLPLKYQEDFRKRLDTSENLCALSPQAHAAIHYGDEKVAAEIVKCLFRKKRELRLKFGVSEDLLLRLYGLD